MSSLERIHRRRNLKAYQRHYGGQEGTTNSSELSGENDTLQCCLKCSVNNSLNKAIYQSTK
ncbi:Hypothetical protein FKW44_005234, partial [Caligus rogercresseyi]